MATIDPSVSLDPSLPQRIRAIAICVFRQGDQILVFEGFDPIKSTHYYRPLGGGIEPGETSAIALSREIQEEIGQSVTNLTLLGVLENLFILNGKGGHEIVFVYDGELCDRTIYDQPQVVGYEDNGKPFFATWKALDFFNDHHRLVPQGLFELLTRQPTV